MGVEVSNIATQVFQSLKSARQIAPISSENPAFDTTSAYQVTAGLRALRVAAGERPVGRKIGFTNRTIWDEYGVFAPIWGDVFATTLFHTDAAATGKLSLDGLCEPRIEPEIVFGLAGPITPDMDDASLIGSLDWIAHGFEVVQSIYPDWKFSIADTIACGGLHGRMIVGPKQRLSRWTPGNLARALAGFTITLSCDGAPIDQGAGANVLDSPLNALRHLAGVLADDPLNPPVKAGEIITTGTLTRAFPVEPGQTWTTQLTGLDMPGLKVAFN